jgi:hypothetical protein
VNCTEGVTGGSTTTWWEDGMIQAIDPNATKEYVCACDTEEPKAVWTLGVLDSRMLGFIDDAVTKLELGTDAKAQAEPAFRTGTRRWLLVKYGLRGWTNWLGVDGMPIEPAFDTVPHFGRGYQAVPDRLLERLPTEVMTELANELSRQNKIGEALKAPFGSPSS